MLKLGLETLTEQLTVATRYQQAQTSSDDLLLDEDTDIHEVKAYQEAMSRMEAANEAARAQYEEQIKANEAKLNDQYREPALAALNVDTGITPEDYGLSIQASTEMIANLKSQATLLAKQGFPSMTEWAKAIPSVSGSLSASDAKSGEAKSFTPKFLTVTINGESQTKVRGADITAKLKITREQFLTAFTAPWAGDKKVWEDANPGFTHTFPITKNDQTYTVTVVKASKTKAETPGYVDPNANQPVDGSNEVAPTDNDAPVAF
jgi:hypothetical protein